jgi:hypothetical protein
MIEQLSFKRLILRAVLRHVSPMVIRQVAVSDQMNLPEFNDIFCAVLGWSGNLGYIFRVHAQEFNKLSPEDAIQSLARIPTAPAGKAPLHLRHLVYVGVGRSSSRHSGGDKGGGRASLSGWSWRYAARVLRRSNWLPADAEAAK